MFNGYGFMKWKMEKRIKKRIKKRDRINYFILFPVLFFIVHAVPLWSDLEDNNLLVNDDFEDQDLNGWNREKWNEDGVIELTDTNVFKGNYSCKIFSGYDENDIRLTQEVKVEPNTNYMLSGWIATRDVQKGKIGANISIIGGFHHAGDVEGTEGWKFYELKFRTSKQ